MVLRAQALGSRLQHAAMLMLYVEKGVSLVEVSAYSRSAVDVALVNYEEVALCQSTLCQAFDPSALN